DGGIRQPGQDPLADVQVLMQQVRVVLVCVPLALPGIDDPQAKADRVDFVTHTLYLSSTTIVMWLYRRVHGFARPRAPARNRRSRVPSFAIADLTRNESTSSE